MNVSSPFMHSQFHRRRRLMLAGGAMLALAGPSLAQTVYPSKPVRVVIPGGAGSGPDTLTRLLTSKLAELWGQPVVAENVVGAGGNIGHERVAKSLPDGHTLLMGMIGPMAINPALMEGRLGFDPIKDLQPISMVVRYPNLLVVHPSLPFKGLSDLINHAKAVGGDAVPNGWDPDVGDTLQIKRADDHRLDCRSYRPDVSQSWRGPATRQGRNNARLGHHQRQTSSLRSRRTHDGRVTSAWL